MHIHIHDEKLRCPYKGCGKSFDKPAVLTDTSTTPRETYYACPYCQSKIDIQVDDMKIVNIKPAEYPKVLDSPAKCPRHFGFLNTIPQETPIPEECLLCPKVLQCTVRQKERQP
jgi:DNA-directed RNA polymerase subunit RPC12/RpoP